MKGYKHIVVSGCSFTAPNPKCLINSGETYGDLISDYLGAKCYNLAVGGGSLSSMNRKVFEWCGKNMNKFEDTLIILGVTNIDRVEFWSNKKDGWFDDKPDWPFPQILQVDISDEIGWSLKERKKYFIKFYNENAVFITAINILVGLQSFFKLNNIDHIFFDAMYPIDEYWETWCDDKYDLRGYKLLFDNLVSYENWYKHPEYKSMIDFTQKNPEMRLKDDHPNKKAHKYWADSLIKYFEGKGR